MRKHVAWFRFARRSSLALAIGWLALLAAFLPWMKLNQAGALLICAAIVAEVFHEKRHRLFIHQVTPGYRESYEYREIVSDTGQKSIEITPSAVHTGKSTVPSGGWPLYHLAKPNEFYTRGSTRAWDLERTVARAERVVDIAIVGTTIVGTILWAFA
jgi:hypothetical protein